MTHACILTLPLGLIDVCRKTSRKVGAFLMTKISKFLEKNCDFSELCALRLTAADCERLRLLPPYARPFSDQHDLRRQALHDIPEL
jgi:hypothetical protein